MSRFFIDSGHDEQGMKHKSCFITFYKFSVTAKKVNARLIELGETPVVEIEPYPVITDIKEMLEYDCKDAAEALPMMSKSLAMFDDDYVTRHMIEQFILDEQEHYNWVKGHLCLIEQIGMENYMIEMLGD